MGIREMVKDGGLIRSGLKEQFRQKSLDKRRPVDELVVEAFISGLSYYALNNESIPRIEPKDLVDDEFSYMNWQLNLYSEIDRQSEKIQWAEVKSAFLEKGLEEIG